MKTTERPRGIVVIPLVLILVGMAWLVKEHSIKEEEQARPEIAPSASSESSAAVEDDSGPGQTRGHAARRASVNGLASVQRLSHLEESPSWAVEYGREFWRRPALAENQSVGAGPEEVPGLANCNLREVVERVSHAWQAEGEGGPLQVKSRSYTAVLENQGILFSPHLPVELTDTALGTAFDEDLEQPGEEPDVPSRHHRSRQARRVAAQPDPETAARFVTMSVEWDGQTLFTSGQSTREWSVLGNTAQALLNEKAGLVEHFETARNGMEVTWVLSKPVGVGPLVVEAAMEGLSYVGQTEAGLHFADAHGKARVRVGPVVAVDALGDRWKLAMTAQGNRLRLEVPKEILAQATYPVAIDPALEAEFGMDKPIVCPRGDDQYYPAVAASSSGFLVVWEDYRNEDMTDGDIYGARLTSAGAVNDPNGLTICTAASYQGSPAVVANGTDYLVVWEDDRSYSLTGSDVYGARVTKAGMVSDPNGFPICTAASYQGSPTVAANGTDFLVVWQDDRNSGLTGRDVYGARVSKAGSVSDPNGFAICTVVNEQFHPKVAASGSDFLVVWSDARSSASTGYDIYGARVTRTGVVSDPNGLAICTATSYQSAPAVAADQSDYLVVWVDQRNLSSSGYDIYGARVTTAGGIKDPDGIAVCAAPLNQSSPAVAAIGMEYLVVWEHYQGSSATGYDVNGARVSSAGVVLDPNALPICTAVDDQDSPAVAANGLDYLVVWEDDRSDGSTSADIYGARVTTKGVVSPAANGGALVTGPNAQYEPAVAADSNGCLVVWRDGRDYAKTGANIYGALLTSAGAVSTPNGLAICTAARDQFTPAVAANGTDYLVVWEDERNSGATASDIYGTRVTRTGVVSDPEGLAICRAAQYQLDPAVAANGSDFLVVWYDQRNSDATSSDIYGARVTGAGVVSDPNGVAICRAAEYQASPCVAANGTDYLVVWTDYRMGRANIYGARVTRTGVVRDPSGLSVCRDASAQYHPTVSAVGSNFFVVWEDHRNYGTSACDIYGARVTGSGLVSDPSGLALCTTVSDQREPVVASDGTNYLVVWRDGFGLSRRRVTPAGSLLESVPVPINSSGARFLPALACCKGKFLLVTEGVRQGARRTLGTLLPKGPRSPGPVVGFQAATFEVKEGAGLATVTVVLSGNNPGAVSVNYSTADGTASGAFDYVRVSGTLFFANGQTRQTFTVPIRNDTVNEPSKTVNLIVSQPNGGATLGPLYRAVLTITDDDAGGQLGFQASKHTVNESAGAVTLTVVRSAGLSSGVAVDYETAGGTAVAGTHYTTRSGTLPFDAGQVNATITIPILNDTLPDGNKTFFVTLYNARGGAKVGSAAVATITISEDD